MPDLRGLPIRRSQPNQRRARVCLNSPLATARRRAPALARRSPTPRSGEQRLARRRRHLTGTQCNATPQSRIFARRPQSFAWATDMRHTLIANDHSPQPRLTPWTATALVLGVLRTSIRLLLRHNNTASFSHSFRLSHPTLRHSLAATTQASNRAPTPSQCCRGGPGAPRPRTQPVGATAFHTPKTAPTTWRPPGEACG